MTIWGKTNVQQLVSTDQQEVPIMLFGTTGKAIFMTGLSRGRYFQSSHFLIRAFCEKRSCAVVELLAMSHYDTTMLFRTEAIVIVDLTCFCGFQVVNKSVFDSLIVTQKLHDQFCRCIPSCPETIWTAHQRVINNSGEIYVVTFGEGGSVGVLLQTTKGTFAIDVSCNECINVSVTNLKSISITKSSIHVKGTLSGRMIFNKESELYF